MPFSREVWEGLKPLVAPLRDARTPFEVGDYVYLRDPVDADGFPAVHGVVVAVSTNEDGEALLRIAQHRVGRGRIEMFLRTIAAHDIDPTVTKHSEPYQSGRMAAAICSSLFSRYERGARWTHDDIELIGSAQLLARLNANTY